MNSMKRQKDRTLKDEYISSYTYTYTSYTQYTSSIAYIEYAIEDQCRNNSRKNEETEPEQKQHPVMYVTGDRSKV